MSSKLEKVAGVILAAGEGSRVGKNKALLEIEGTKFIERITRSLHSAQCQPILVVGGADEEAVRKEAGRLAVRFVMNDDWRLGQFSSLRAGISHVDPEAIGALVTLVDHPLVAEETYVLLLEVFRSSPGKIIIPSHEGRRGHPVVIPARIMEEIVTSPDNWTLRNIMKKHANLIVIKEVADTHILTDIDTEEELKRIDGRGGSAR
jgi:CTP:molybdopterin cytidylyltransferase MocA